MRPWHLHILLSLLVSSLPGYALASDLSIPNLHGWVDFRAAYTTADREWLDGGFSKTRYGDGSGAGSDAELAEASLEWTPTLSAAWSAHVHVQATPDQGVAVGPVEAFVTYRMLPRDGWRLSARAGRYFPAVSLEHDGPGWGVTRTLTPSAINSWIGEEVAITGIEARAGKAFGDHRLDFGLGGFGFNDTSGTLLGYRGWALHDIKTMIGGSFQIPDDETRRVALPHQAERTRPFQELDDRVGVTATVRWRYADLLTVLASYYDNRADPTELRDGQYGWETRFGNLGAKYEVTEDTEVIVQAMYGETAMGWRARGTGPRMIESDFYSAFLLASHRPSENLVLSARADYFATSDAGFIVISDDEDGWAGTLSARYQISDNLETGLEALYVDSNGGNDPTTAGRVEDLQLQLMLRVGF